MKKEISEKLEILHYIVEDFIETKKDKKVKRKKLENAPNISLQH